MLKGISVGKFYWFGVNEIVFRVGGKMIYGKICMGAGKYWLYLYSLLIRLRFFSMLAVLLWGLL